MENNAYVVVLSEIKQGTKLCIQCDYNYVNQGREKERERECVWAEMQQNINSALALGGEINGLYSSVFSRLSPGNIYNSFIILTIIKQ